MGRTRPAAGPAPAGAGPTQPAALVVPLAGTVLEQRQQLQRVGRALKSSQLQQVVLDCQGKVLGAHAGLARLLASLDTGMLQLVVRRACLDIAAEVKLQGRLRLEKVRLRATPKVPLMSVEQDGQLELDHCVIEPIPLTPSQAAAARNVADRQAYLFTGTTLVGEGGHLKADRTVWKGLAQCLSVMGGSALLEDCWINCTGIWCPYICGVQASARDTCIPACLLKCLWSGCAVVAAICQPFPGFTWGACP